MKKNMGVADKAIRLVLAAVFIVLFAFELVSGTWGYALLALAAIFILTSFVSFCPLYYPFGIRTCKKAQE